MRGPTLDRDSIAFIVRVMVHMAEFLLVNSEVHISVAGDPKWNSRFLRGRVGAQACFPQFHLGMQRAAYFQVELSQSCV
jgi:hypothetical protein